MNILLLGANGQLGRTFVERRSLDGLGRLVCASRDGRRFDGVSVEVADLAQPDTLASVLDRTQPRIIVNAAAYTAVDRAESEEPLAHMVNGEAVRQIGQWAHEHAALVVHYSTDYVFDGSATQPYSVNSATSPLGAYGRSKLAGELALRASGAACFIFRTAWVYSAWGQNFLRTMLRLGAERDTLQVVADQRGTPTPTALIVDGTMAALRQWLASTPTERIGLEGTYHLVARGEVSWHGFASAILELGQAHGLLRRQPTIQPISTEQFPTLARRPAYSVLDPASFQDRFAVTIPLWRDGLNAVLTELALKDSNSPC